MELVIESSRAPSLHRVPFLIRLAPEVISRLRGIFSADASISGEINGVLFGVAESDFAVIQALRFFSSLPTGNEDLRGAKTPLQDSLDTILRGPSVDAELSGLELLGWFSARRAIGLRKEDITFHERNFQSRNHVALIVRNEPAGYLSLASYCRSLEGEFSSENHRSGTLRISLVSPPVTPLEMPMRAKMHDDVYMRAYQLGDLDEDGARSFTWKNAFASKTKEVFKRLRRVKPATKLKSAGQEHQPNERFTDNLERVKSMTQALQYAASGGAAAAPAKVQREPSPSRQPVLERTDDIRPLHSEEPRIVSSTHPAEPMPEQTAPSARAETHVPSASGTSNERSEPERSEPERTHSPGRPQVLGLDSPATPASATPVLTKADEVFPLYGKEPRILSSPQLEPIPEQAAPAARGETHVVTSGTSNEPSEPERTHSPARPQSFRLDSPTAPPSPEPVFAKADKVLPLHGKERRIFSSPQAEPIPEQTAAAARGETHVATSGTSHEPSEPERTHGPARRHLLGLESPAAPPSRQPVLERTDDIRPLHSEEPRTVSSTHPAEPIPEQTAPSARGETHVATSGTSNEPSEPEPTSSLPRSQLFGLHSAPTPSRESEPILPAQVANLAAASPRKLRWLVSAAVFAVATVGTWAFLYWKNIGDQPASSRSAQVDLRSSRLGLRLSKAQNRVRISWDQQSPILRNASEAILQINDGLAYRAIRLSESELATGSLLYLPKTSNAAVRLEAHDTTGQVVSESARIGNGSNFSKVTVTRSGSRTEATVPSSASPVDAPSAEGSQGGGRHTLASARSVSPNPIEARAHNGKLKAENQPLTPGDRTSMPDPANRSAAPEASRPAPTNSYSSGQGVALFRPPRPIEQVLPKLDGLQRDLADVTELRVLVRVNEAGRVIAARLLETSKNVSAVVNRAVLEAARQWTFVPASMNGKSIESDHTIVFRLAR